MVYVASQDAREGGSVFGALRVFCSLSIGLGNTSHSAEESVREEITEQNKKTRQKREGPVHWHSLQ